MLQITEKKRAQYMLDAHHQGGPTFAQFIRTNRVRYAGFVGYFAIFCGYLAFSQQWFFFWVFLSFVLGALISDVSWFRGTKKTWVLLEKVVDWDHLKRLAE